MKAHPDKALLDELFPAVRKYQELATKHGVNDIFQDNGGKLLQLVLLLGLTALESREGNDAKDDDGNEYELKTVNISLTRSFSTHHHLNPTILAKYRQVDWYMAIYDGIELRRVFRVKPAALEPLFSKWEKKWHDKGGKDINNPKINVSFVETVGELIYSEGPEPVLTTLDLLFKDEKVDDGDIT